MTTKARAKETPEVPVPLVEQALQRPIPDGATRYIIEFIDKYHDFRLPELVSVADLLGVVWQLHTDCYSEADVYIIADYKGDVSLLKELAQRTILIKYVAVLYAHGRSLAACLENIHDAQLAPYIDASFKIDFSAHGKKPSNRISKIDQILAQLPCRGAIDLHTPVATHLCIEDYGIDAPIAPTLQKHKLKLKRAEKDEEDRQRLIEHQQKQGISTSASEPTEQNKGGEKEVAVSSEQNDAKKGATDTKKPKVGGSRKQKKVVHPSRVFLAVVLAQSRRGELINMFDLKVRNMIGNTSMDPELSLIQANMAKAAPGTLAIDPFCGTASLLLPCAYFGSVVTGGDIAFQVIFGVGKTSRANQASKERGPKENIWSNFKQYGLSDKLLDVLVADTSTPSWRNEPLFDLIVSDPPYGIREQTRKIGTAKEKASDKSKQKATVDSGPADEEEEGRKTPEERYPQSERYDLGTIFHDLVLFATQRLVVGGRLSFWIPEVLEDTDLNVPTHPCMEIVSTAQQLMTARIARRLVTMEKKRDPQVGEVVTSGLPKNWNVRKAVFVNDFGAEKSAS